MRSEEIERIISAKTDIDDVTIALRTPKGHHGWMPCAGIGIGIVHLTH